jgi:hypothetical protein
MIVVEDAAVIRSTGTLKTLAAVAASGSAVLMLVCTVEASPYDDVTT